jgi:hypothetical protein
MEFPKFEGNYLGIVVQNNDPLRRGRVKVFVPHISPTVYKDWVEKNEDLAFRFLGDNISSDLSVILDDLKKILPWANVAMPVVGEIASGRYNDTTKYATTSDTNDFNELQDNSARTSEIGSNIDGVGEKTGAVFDQNAFMLADAFNNPAETSVNNVNKLSFNYKPETYSNCAKGSFAIPRVGAHVWVFFNGGNPLKPVIFAAAHGSDDWGGIFNIEEGADQGQDYPGEFENFTGTNTESEANSTYTINTETYRNKYVLNQKGGTIQFVNTDNRELLKMTHFSGSFFEMNNQANITLAINNDQKLVVGDSFTTIRGTRNEFTQMDYDCVVQGDNYRKVGDPGRVLLYEEWKSLLKDIANIKQLFDIQRCDPVQGIPQNAKSLIKLNAEGQVKTGTPRLCPLCTAIDDGGRDISINNFFKIEDASGTFAMKVKPHDSSTKYGDAAFGGSRWQQDGHAKFPDGTKAFGQDARLCLNSSTKPVIVDSQGNVLIQRPGFIASIPGKETPCPLCNNVEGGGYNFVQIPGQSPSSFGGIWTPDPKKLQLPTMYDGIAAQLAELEAAMGKGGTEIIEIEKNKIETIGLVMNDWGAVRIDPYGKMEPAEVRVFPGFTRVVPQPSPLIEIVQVDDLPGGTYSLNVANKYNLLVGAGGIIMKSYGVINIAGAVTTIAGEQVNIGSAMEVNIDGGKRLSLRGDIVSIAQRNRGQVLVDSDLGVTGKTTIRGALYVEGPIYTHEIHSVGKLQQTNRVVLHSAGYPAASPPTPMGTLITSDKAHQKQGEKGEDGVAIGAGEGQNNRPIYLGYTDPQRSVAYAPEDLLLGVLPQGAQIQLTGDFGNPFNPSETKTFTISLKVPVVAAANVTPADVAAANGSTAGALSLTEIAEILPKEQNDKYNLVTALGDAPPKGAFIPGAGYGSVQQQNNLPLRGLPEVQREKIKLEFSAGDASSAPGVTYGDGSDWDAIKSSPASTTFVGPATDVTAQTNLKLRLNWIDSDGIPSLVGHGPQNGEGNEVS